jgi:hypothetical protein
VGIFTRSRPVRALAVAWCFCLVVTTAGRAACFGPQQILPPETVAEFISNPARLLSAYPDGGARMIAIVRDLVASDSTALSVVVDLSVHANAAQVNAIGTGLGQAALVCVRTDQAFANDIQQMVAASNNQPLALALTDVLGDQQLAAASSGSGGGGGGGGQTGDSRAFGGFVGSGAQLNLTTTVKTPPTNFPTMTSNGLVIDPPSTPGGPVSVSPSR